MTASLTVAAPRRVSFRFVAPFGLTASFTVRGPPAVAFAPFTCFVAASTIPPAPGTLAGRLAVPLRLSQLHLAEAEGVVGEASIRIILATDGTPFDLITNSM